MSQRKYKVGDRVQMHPATDEWMMGDRYGTVVNVGVFHRTGSQIVRVRLDKSGKTRPVHPDNLILVK